MYAAQLCPHLISRITDAFTADVSAWSFRLLERTYPMVFFDALRLKIREDGVVRSKAVPRAFGVLPDGSKDILGI